MEAGITELCSGQNVAACVSGSLDFVKKEAKKTPNHLYSK